MSCDVYQENELLYPLGDVVAESVGVYKYQEQSLVRHYLPKAFSKKNGVNLSASVVYTGYALS